MHLLSLLALFGALALASPLDMFPAAEHNDTLYESRNIPPAEMHANVLKSYPSELIITSDELNTYMAAHQGTNPLVYLSDTQQWVTRANESNISALSRRQCNSGEYFLYSSVYASKTLWYPWQPISNCLSNNKDSGTATMGFSWSYTVTIAESGGVGYAGIVGALSASVGFSVTESWSESGMYSCPVPGGTSGQIWGRKWVAWAQLKNMYCNNCNGEFEGADVEFENKPIIAQISD
ncbi:hypothetical protein N431DRAFT_524905 [Stipitochalara longipes BDJ]|nr:hypothetical protein N431DRAFT_524905 [Stipitochalara longipes BDJ]